MSGLRSSVVTLGWLAAAGLAFASPASGSSAPLRLVAPQAGASLLAGSYAELEWEAAELSPELIEWEAFLSFDGGGTYPVRITPHLDRDLRRVRWQVPGVATSDARLLLRFGDERREISCKLPQRFSIRAAPGTERTFTFANTAAAPGEAALPGHAGVVAWVEGSRRGGTLRQMVAPEPPSLHGALNPSLRHRELAIVDAEETQVQPSASVRRSADEAVPADTGASLTKLASHPLFSFDILLLTQRQNE